MPAPPAPRSNRSISLKRKVLALAIAQAMLGHAHAATITVDSLLDDDGNGCTLREAIANANDSALSGNGCVSEGGGFYNRHTINVTNSTLSNKFRPV